MHYHDLRSCVQTHDLRGRGSGWWLGKFVTVKSIGIRGLQCSRYCGSKSSRLQGSGGQAAFSLLWLYLLLGVSLDPAKNPKDLEVATVSMPGIGGRGGGGGWQQATHALGAVVGASGGLVSTSATPDAASLACRSLKAHLPRCLRAPEEVQGPCLPGCPAAGLPGPDNHSAPPEPRRQPDLHAGRTHGQEVVRRHGHRGKPDGPHLPSLPQPCARQQFGGLPRKGHPDPDPLGGSGPRTLGVLQHLPLREIHLGVCAPNPAILWFARTVRGRVGWAVVRGARGWPTQGEARRLLMPACERR